MSKFNDANLLTATKNLLQDRCARMISRLTLMDQRNGCTTKTLIKPLVHASFNPTRIPLNSACTIVQVPRLQAYTQMNLPKQSRIIPPQEASYCKRIKTHKNSVYTTLLGGFACANYQSTEAQLHVDWFRERLDLCPPHGSTYDEKSLKLSI